MTLVILFVLGLIIGSFLNVLALRLRSGLTLGGRSACFSCAKTLEWWELIPVLSFIFLRGRCSSCKTRISWQYPLVELWTGIFFVSLYFVSNTLLDYIFFTTIFSLYTAILVYDIRHKIIPDSLVFLSVILSLIYRFLIGGTLFDWLAGPIFFSFFGLIWLLSRGRAMGFGDAKLWLSVGLLLGFSQSLSAFALAAWIALLVTLPLMIFGMLKSGKKLTMKSEIPFAPFIIIGAWVSLAFSLNLFYASLFS